MLSYALVGYGRMGHAIEAVAGERGHRRVAVIDAASPGVRIDAGRLAGAEVAFEFSVPEAAEANIAALVRNGVSVVAGTTGWSASDALRHAVEESGVGVVIAPNFSVGMNLFFRVVEHAAKLFGRVGLHEPFVHEVHHRGKRDVPSGTARRLARIVVASDPRLERVCEGHPGGPLSPNTLQVVGSRVGREPGSHVVGFSGEHDVVRLAHDARGREGFALGAVLAAEWLPGRRGWHDFDEVLDESVERGTEPGGGPLGG